MPSDDSHDEGDTDTAGGRQDEHWDGLEETLEADLDIDGSEESVFEDDDGETSSVTRRRG